MWTALGIVLLWLPLLLIAGLLTYVYWYARQYLLDQVERIFPEKPLFVIPRGETDPTAENLRIPTADGMYIQGAYFRTSANIRKGLVIFGIEYGSDRWSCRSYCEPLLQAGYDIFTYEPRSQGASDSIPGYEPLQWITRYEVADARAALAYVKNRPDVQGSKIGWFGVSKGANAGLAVATKDRTIRCVATDGAFGLSSVMLPYMRKWIGVYNPNFMVHGLFPAWFYAHMAMVGVRRVGLSRKVQFFHLDPRMGRLRQPLLMIHGEKDSYIKMEMARAIFRRARGPKEFWAVDGARHNQSITLAGAEYGQRVVAFFDEYLR